MQTQLETLHLSFPALRLNAGDAPLLRGAFAAANPAAPALHNHSDAGLQYRYPTVQYKVLRGKPHIVAFGDGIDPCLATVRGLDTLRLGSRSWQSPSAQINFAKPLVGDAETPLHYQFATPWLALNQENHQRYAAATPEAQQALLENILKGNILSFAKGLGLQVENYLQLTANVTPMSVPYKGQTMLAFVGSFCVNYHLPSGFGLGKGVARGFGAVQPC